MSNKLLNKKDQIRVSHIVSAVREVEAFLKEVTLSDFQKDRMLVLAITKELEIIGEAAAQVEESTKKSLPELPWRKMLDMRNRLIHGYFDIDEDIVFQTATHDLQSLKKILQTLKLYL